MKAKSIRSYVSLLKGYFEHEYSFDILVSDKRIKRLVKSMLEEEPLGGVRKKRRGFR